MFKAMCYAEYRGFFHIGMVTRNERNAIIQHGTMTMVRKSTLMEVNGWAEWCITEDAELGLKIFEKGYEAAYTTTSYGRGVMPDTFIDFKKQRFRWAFGTLQCLWKHADLVFNPDFKALGWFSLPSIWFCQILLVAITPMVDLLLILSLLAGNAAAMGIFFIAFMAMDMLLALVACAMDDEPRSKAWLILPMRLIYRPLLSWVVWKAILKAFKGAWVTWGKLERTASVEVKLS
jgi:cellulose synthase/poly-beta-1,6-N-acetylglucosamine synthase-like glycosyltransferase